MTMYAYSFADVTCSIVGEGASLDLSDGGNAEEGITIAAIEDKNTMTIGADGTPMHSLHAGKGGTATIRLLKTSLLNAQLQTLYNYQITSSAYHGTNTISVANVYSGDSITCSICAFKKVPDLSYAKDGGTVEWAFDCGRVNYMLGSGS